ncbi:MAG: hypothetical protein GXO79_04665 [Chlorobi bacterium]|nr:hypothetical protein [Chlorobiota bacterium]
MFKPIINFLVVILFIVCAKQLNSQVLINVKFIGLSGHLKKSPHPQLYKLKLDKNGFLVLNTGVMLGVEKQIWKPWFSVKFAQGILSDCAMQFAGFTHLGFRLTYNTGNHYFSIGNGPTLFYRNDWNKLPGYVDEGLFKRNKKFQYLFFWYAGEVEYNYKISENTDIGITFIPGPPEFFTIIPGVRIKID